jgi:hypothetical protein
VEVGYVKVLGVKQRKIQNTKDTVYSVSQIYFRTNQSPEITKQRKEEYPKQY